MARRRQVVQHDDTREILRYYREMLAEPAEPVKTEYPATHFGPAWETDHRGRFILPERSAGWAGMVWAGQNLQLSRGNPWKFTPEQARLWLWWYAVDEQGDFEFTSEGIIQRLKGWGKDPWASVYLANELLGPCRPDGFRRGEVIATPEPDAWVQVLAVSLKQTKNTMRLFPRLFTDEAKAEYQIQVNKGQIYALGDTRLLEAMTSNPDPIEGARTTAVLGNEMQYWRDNNNGRAMYEVVQGNLTKNPGQARFLGIANAFQPGMDSVLERTRLAYEASISRPDEVSMPGLMYDTLEANPKAPLFDDDDENVIEKIILTVRGDATWLKPARIRAGIQRATAPPSESRRKWYNQVTAREDSWCDPMQWDGNGDSSLTLELGDEIAMFFDGSKSDDATVLVGCRISDGAVFPLGLWQAPPKARRGTWTAPRGEVSKRVRQIMRDYRVVGFFADPSHTREDGTLERYWQSTIDKWHQDFGGRLIVQAKAGRDGHSIIFDMSNKTGEGAKFVEAAEAFIEDVESGDMPHNKHLELARHVKNAIRFPTQHGISLMKDGPESPRKIDLAVAAVGARMVRRLVLNLAGKRRGQGTGGVW